MLSGHVLSVEIASDLNFVPDNGDKATKIRDFSACLDMCLSDVPMQFPKLFQTDRDIYPRVLLFLRDHCKQFFQCPFRHIVKLNEELCCRRNKSRITQALPGQAQAAQHDAGDFPHNIFNWIWWYTGNDLDGEGEMWLLLCQLDNGMFAFFAAATSASAGYSKFRDNGRNVFEFERMQLFVAPRPAPLISLAMRETEYASYLAQTVPVRHWDSDTSFPARQLAVAMIAHRRLGKAAGRWAAEVVGNRDVMLLVWARAEGDY
jgi:hypothetical protein